MISYRFRTWKESYRSGDLPLTITWTAAIENTLMNLSKNGFLDVFWAFGSGWTGVKSIQNLVKSTLKDSGKSLVIRKKNKFSVNHVQFEVAAFLVSLDSDILFDLEGLFLSTENLLNRSTLLDHWIAIYSCNLDTFFGMSRTALKSMLFLKTIPV